MQTAAFLGKRVAVCCSRSECFLFKTFSESCWGRQRVSSPDSQTVIRQAATRHPSTWWTGKRREACFGQRISSVGADRPDAERVSHQSSYHSARQSKQISSNFYFWPHEVLQAAWHVMETGPSVAKTPTHFTRVSNDSFSHVHDFWSFIVELQRCDVNYRTTTTQRYRIVLLKERKLANSGVILLSPPDHASTLTEMMYSTLIFVFIMYLRELFSTFRHRKTTSSTVTPPQDGALRTVWFRK